jgi:hypothetical protein
MGPRSNPGRLRSAEDLLVWFRSPAGRFCLRRLGRRRALRILEIALWPIKEGHAGGALDDALCERVLARAGKAAA